MSFAQITYTASASTAWGVNTTWTPNGIPTTSDIVIIPVGKTVTLDNTGDVCNTLTVSGTLTGNGKTLTVGSGGVIITGGTITFTTGVLKDAGNYTDNGTFTYGTGKVTFNGTATQTISGTESPVGFYDLTSNPGAGVTVSMAVPITINNNFTISQGTFNCSSNQITSTGANIMTMSAGTTFILGSSAVATAVTFPTGFSTITLDPTSTVIYEANTNQTISGIPNYGNLTITAGTATTTNKLNSAVTIYGNLLIQDGSGVSVVTFDQNGKAVGLYGNLTDNGILLSSTNGGATDSFLGTSGVQALSSTEGGGLNFFDVVVNNTAATTPDIITTAVLNVSDQLTYTSGNLDLQGNNFNITTAAANTDALKGGTIITSVAGSNFNVTDPDTSLTMHFYGTWIGNQSIGITINVVAAAIEFENFVEYGTASFTKDGEGTSNTFSGGNGFHGPVTFTSYRTTALWKFGVYSASPSSPDTFYNATLNAGGNYSGNDNFIIGANNTTTFNGTTTINSTTLGGVYFGRSNGTGNASIIFNGPVICNIGLTGNVTFADAGASNLNSATFNSTIQLNSTTASTGYYYFGDNKYSTITLSSTGQFVGTGSLLGKSNTYLEELTQNGTTLTQTINTAGSTGFLEIGGTASAPGKPCTFNAPCVFSADTAGYIVSATFASTAPLTFNVNHPSANGYLLSSTFNGTVNATIGAMRIQNNTFNSTTTLTGTNSVGTDSSVQNGGNTFNAPVSIINTGSAFLYFSQSASDYFNSDVTFTLDGPCEMGVAANYPAYFKGNITINGTAAEPFYMGYYYTENTGGMVIDGSGTQVISIAGSVLPIVFIRNMTMNMTAAGTNVFEFSNFSPQLVAGTLTFNSGNTGLINLNGNAITFEALFAFPTVIGTISYPAASTGTPAGWIYGGTVVRNFNTGTVALPTGATKTTTATTGFFPMGSSPALNVFQPLWVSFTGGGGVTSTGSVSVHQPSNTGWFTSITPYTDISMGQSIIGVSNADWTATTGGGLAIGGTANIAFGGFGFQNFVDGDVNASYATTYATGSTWVIGQNLWGATDVEVERTGLSLAQLAATWHIGTDNVTASPLPIQLTSFTADCDNYAALVKWTSATETNNDYYTLDKTQDGYNYSSVAQVKGAGTSSTPQNYSVTDENPFTATSYYRLSQTDLDGKTTIVGTAVYVPCENENEINSFAYNKTIKVEINTVQSGAYTIAIYNSIGQQVSIQTVNASLGLNTYSLMPNTTDGFYVVRVSGSNTSYTKKVVLGL